MILRDPVHGLVAFESAEEAVVPQLLEAPEVQRLRRVRQLGLTFLAYPGADHTRFSHAVGAAHVMTRLLARLRRVQEDLPLAQRLGPERGREALVAALLHDVGHGPFSHLFEDALEASPTHEEWTRRILLDEGTELGRTLATIDARLPATVAELVQGRHPLPYLGRTVSGTFDVDRCDYLLRDAYFTGVGYGSFDLDWLLRSFRFTPASSAEGPASLAIDGAKGLPAIESFILARLFMFQQVYFHKASRAAEVMVRQILRRLRRLSLDGVRLPAVPAALVRLCRTGDCSLGEYLELDDSVLWNTFSLLQGSDDALLADLCRRLVRRQLFKTWELHDGALSEAGRAHALEVAREVARAGGLDPDLYVALDAASDVPFDDARDPLGVVFAKGAPRKPGDVSFLLGRLRGQRMERVRIIVAAELRDQFVRAISA